MVKVVDGNSLPKTARRKGLNTAPVPIPALPERPPAAHKGSFGHVLVVAGSRSMTGAAALSALSALRAGAGLVTIAAPEPLLPLIAPIVPEATHLPLASHPHCLVAGDVAAILEFLHARASVLAIGPGSGRGEPTRQAVREVLLVSERPAVIDADALSAFSGAPETLRQMPAAGIITPHPGELAALLGRSVPDIQQDRVGAALEAARRTGRVAVLKGHGTLVADEHRLYQNRSGGPALAKGGAGDVLTGMAAAFMAQKMPLFEAAVLAVYLHGLAGDLAAERLAGHAVLARDVIESLPQAMRKHAEGDSGG